MQMRPGLHFWQQLFTKKRSQTPFTARITANSIAAEIARKRRAEARRDKMLQLCDRWMHSGQRALGYVAVAAGSVLLTLLVSAQPAIDQAENAAHARNLVELENTRRELIEARARLSASHSTLTLVGNSADIERYATQLAARAPSSKTKRIEAE